MEKKAKIIATLGPAIHSENKLKAIVNAGPRVAMILAFFSMK